MEKNYSPSDIEDRLYTKWLDKGYFHAEVDKSKRAFSIVMPPPNVTGKLHMGHALDNTMQDILIRFKRMQGFSALWVPGTDHASISTEVKVINALKEEGIDKKDLGREGFLKRTWEWKEEYGGTIIAQLKKIGSSCDWERERFTMDEGLSKAVTRSFINLYDKGLIYKGARIINWCPVCKTSISDAEVEYEEKDGKFYHIKYPVTGEESRFVELATTRPETMLGDTAVAVNPADERYKDLVGKTVTLPLVGREIPVIADEYVDMEFGTGVVKITPAHDPNDFAVGERHDLPQINILNDDATVNENGGRYQGMDRYEARKAVLADLEAQGLLVGIKEHLHNVGTHDRCGTTVEPMIKEQWFVRMQDIIEPAVEGVKSGEIRLIPSSIEKTYYHWTDNIRDWCISRQLWWGHRIPAYYCDSCGHITVAEEAPGECPKCGGSVRQDEDTLDTWFSSALWPFSTLGWPEKTEELDYFYPTSVLVTGYDILFFWVIRMIFSGYEHMGKPPFRDVLFHGLVRDEQGRKMSKSLGNGIDPIDVIEKYGADALRASLISNTSPGNDMRFFMSRVEAARNFANKIWNSARFIMMNDENSEINPSDPMPENLTDADKWILSGVNRLIKDVTDNLNKYELGIAYDKIDAFAWDEFCDWYVEMVKSRLYNDADDTKAAAIWTLKKVLISILKLLHPFMPFVTEEVFCAIQSEEESVVISKWPEYSDDLDFPEEESATKNIQDAVKAVRGIRAEKNVPPSKKLDIYVVTDKKDILDVFEKGHAFFRLLSGAQEVLIKENADDLSSQCVTAVIENAMVYIPLSDLVDLEEEKQKLTQEMKRLEGEVKRCEGMLANENFVAKAPEAKIAEEREKLEKYKQMLENVKENLSKL